MSKIIGIGLLSLAACTAFAVPDRTEKLDRFSFHWSRRGELAPPQGEFRFTLVVFTHQPDGATAESTFDDADLVLQALNYTPGMETLISTEVAKLKEKRKVKP